MITRDTGKEGPVRLLGAAVFLSAFLLFCSEPMIGKMMLPLLGGVSSVWITCVLFFQLMLLAGYVYVHLIERLLNLRTQIIVHSLLMVGALFFLPMRFTSQANDAAVSHPTFWLLIELTKTVGIPFFVVSTSAPLLQNWFSKTALTGGGDPYFLYALSNGGSLGALLAYPLLIEPRMGVRLQSSLWFGGYGVFVLTVFGVSALVLKYYKASFAAVEPQVPDTYGASAPSWEQRLYWTAAAFVPSALMLAVTNHILQNLAPVPLLWTIPLAIYLITFMLAFGRTTAVPLPLLSRLFPFVVLLLLPIVVHARPSTARSSWMLMAGHIVVLLAGALLCHTALASSRPAPSHLTEFYLWAAVGGALGGIFTGVIAPLVFSKVLEYPVLVAMLAFFRSKDKGDGQESRDWKAWLYVSAVLLLLAVLWVVLGVTGRALTTELSASLWMNLAAVSAAYLLTRRRFALAGAVGAVAFAYWILVPGFSEKALLAANAGVVGTVLLFRHRKFGFALTLGTLILSYWGVSATIFASGYQELYVERNFFGIKKVLAGANTRTLLHGDTMHGLESFKPGMAGEPLSYFHKTGPVGDVMRMMERRSSQRVGVVGLGAGTVAAYGNAARKITFYEIDPQVDSIAKDYFGFLRRCGENCDVAVGDGRLLVQKAADHEFDLLMLDAFNADSVPPHLVSREAIHLYLLKLKPDGLLLFNVTNGYIRLERLIAAVAADSGLVAFVRYDFDEKPPGKSASGFVVAARRVEDLGTLPRESKWSQLMKPTDLAPWTDDYSNMLTILRWR